MLGPGTGMRCASVSTLLSWAGMRASVNSCFLRALRKKKEWMTGSPSLPEERVLLQALSYKRQCTGCQIT